MAQAGIGRAENGTSQEGVFRASVSGRAASVADSPGSETKAILGASVKRGAAGKKIDGGEFVKYGLLAVGCYLAYLSVTQPNGPKALASELLQELPTLAESVLELL